MITTIDFIKKLDEPVFRKGRAPGGLHPSGAYHCPLKDYLQMNRVEGLGKTYTAEDIERMEEGEDIHKRLQAKLVKNSEEFTEITVLNEIDVKDPIFNISGRLDSAIINTELKTLGIVEIKTTGKIVSSPYESAENQLATYLGCLDNISIFDPYKDYEREAWFIYHKRGARVYFSGKDLFALWESKLRPYLIDLLGYVGRREEPAPQKHYMYGSWCTDACEYRHRCPIAKKGG